MSAEYLNTLTENASRLGMRLQETFTEHTRDLALTKTSYLDTSDDKTRNIRKQLDSNSDREKLDAMKRLVALISKGRNVSEYFAQVVKNVASHNLEIRKLVYIYLLRYAEQEPDLALLSINTFQKDLTDPNPLIRAMALRVLGGIRVPMIGNIVVLAIKKCAADVSPYVRKVAALAIPKCYELDNAHLPSLIEIITTLLQDRSPLSIGSVAVAFDAVCPTRLDLIHKRYRRLCKVLLDVDEWGQVQLLNLLLRYARTMLPRPISESEIDPDLKLLLDSSAPLFQSRNPAVVLAATRVFFYAGLPSMHTQFVRPLLRLLHVSKEVERVVLAYMLVVTRSETGLFADHYKEFFLFADDTRHVKIQKIKLLLRMMNFQNHQAVLREFIDYAEDTDDQVVSDSIHAIGRCASIVLESTQQCLTALVTMIKSNNDVMVSNAVLVVKNLVQRQLSQSTSSTSNSTSISIISHLAQKIDTITHPAARACVIWLVGQYCETTTGEIASWAPDVLRKSAKSFMGESTIVKLQIITLAAKLVVVSPPNSNLDSLAPGPDLGKTLQLLAAYVFSLARYDLDNDVRDRARMVGNLLIGVFPSLSTGGEGQDADQTLNNGTGERKAGVVLRREQVKLVLFGGKAQSVDYSQEDADSQASSTLGSLSTLTNKPTPLSSQQILPDWLEKGVEPGLRDVPVEEEERYRVVVPTGIGSSGSGSGGGSRGRGISGIGSRGGRGAGPDVLAPPGATIAAAAVSAQKKVGVNGWQDLDKFYEDDHQEEEEESSEEDGEDEEEEGKEEGQEESGEESSEDDEEDEEEEEESGDGSQSETGEANNASVLEQTQSSSPPSVSTSPTVRHGQHQSPQDVYGENVWNAG
ncbi:AP-3 complex subunit beta [Stygiomarasmius scandens]|uniref:AP-3 complex subunit beta n=1 Tax=Marasmiellus scandens TaxID=2682957 RepID=A0ABR1J4K9_9AGAR